MVDETVKVCDWCDMHFVHSEDNRRSDCCSSECETKYNNHMANHSTERPGDKYANDLTKEISYY